ncbi:MAG TPA: aldehyde dehydrogenase family protein [Candidatus Manganitrophaceae bacterium]|nr:aldehyde dehydrogenase family protein [Candidatus Manganitrophaceae bacterium]
MIREYKFWIGGKWKTSSQKLEVINPYNGETVGGAYSASADDVEEAIASSVKAFEETRRLPAFRRAEALRLISEGIAARREEIAKMITLESGKPISDARGEVNRAVNTFQIAGEEAKRIPGEVIPLDLLAGSEGRVGVARRFPVGPVIGISPFNFPLNLVAHKIAPALAAGNSIILKPAPKTPLTALLLAEIISTAGLPDGAVNVFFCPNDLAEKIVVDPRMKIFSFTGSAAVGWYLKEKANKKRVILELGGNAGVIIHSDADLDYAAKRCLVGAFSYSGQVCISVQRIFVQEKIYRPFLDLFIPLIQSLKIGDPMDEKTTMGSMVDQKAAERLDGWIQEAFSQGAKVLIGGKRSGALLEPTVLTETKPEMEVNRREVFGPLVTVTPYTRFEDAIQRMNDSPYGLQAGLFTRDIKEIFHAFEEIQVGGLIVNDVPTYRIDHMPYGGIKESGFGREGLRYAIEEMTELKFMALNLK